MKSKSTQLDPRLRMPMCDKELTASLESPARPLGRVTVKVRCDSAAPWTVFVPAQVRLFREIVTTTRPLKRAGIVEPQDVMLRERDISQITQGFLTSVDQAIGQKLVRPMVADQVVTLVHLEQAEVVRKGDQVVITARTGSLAVRMPGEALSNGGMREQIRVKNLNSQRVIKAQVVAPGQVVSGRCSDLVEEVESWRLIPVFPRLCLTQRQAQTCARSFHK